MEHEKLKEIFNQYKHNYLLNGHFTATPLMDFNNFKYAAWHIENNSPAEPEVSKKFADTIKDAIEYLNFMKLLLNHQGEPVDYKYRNDCEGCKREKKINEIVKQLSKFSTNEIGTLKSKTK